MNINILLLILSTLIFSQNGFAETQDIIFKLQQSSIILSPGRVEKIKMTALVPKNFHAYSDKLKIIKINPESFHVGQIQIENETEFFDKFTKKNRMAFTDSGLFNFQIETPIDFDESIKKVNFSITYQICSEKICFLPRTQNFTLDINYDKENAEKISEKVTTNNISIIDQLKTALTENLFYAFLISFLAGILTSFTPCIFPMIPITISILGHQAEKNSRQENILRSILYVLGIAFTYSTLGVLAALTGSLFGNALSNKYVLIFMVLLFFTMALSMWGIFELQVPAVIRNKLGVGKKNGLLGVFVMGLISGIVASPCVGPVLVSILSYVATTKNALLGFGLLFTYAIGLGLIFILIGAFSQLLALLPKSGAWMNRVKFILGLFMLLTGLYYLRLAFPTAMTTTTVSQNKNLWQNYTTEILQAAKSNHMPVIIDFRADWCAACHELDEKTFTHEEFRDLSKGFLLLKVDATEDTPAVQMILEKYNVKGLPTVLFVNRNGDIIDNLTFTQFLEWNEFKPKLLEALKN